MERILYFDCFSGISGDMTLGALIDLGIDLSYVKSELEKLHISGYTLEINPAQQNAISGTDVTVHLTSENTASHHSHTHSHEHLAVHESMHEHPSPHTHEKKHTHDLAQTFPHTHSHSHEHVQEPSHHHDHVDARNLYDITSIIQQSSIKSGAKETAIAIFKEIAAAEAAVHGKTLEEIHFHEVGAVDSIIDIVGTAICLDYLNVDRIDCSVIQDGHGFIECQHGLLPVPVPAVSQMLSGSKLTLITGEIEGELVTPTGFGILKATARTCGAMPAMQVEKVGYGFGKKETGKLNALRVFLGTRSQTAVCTDFSVGSTENTDAITVIETSLDDETGEILAYAMDLLFEAGALDVYHTPIVMKKNRPAVLLTVLCREQDLNKMADILFRETSTIGLRHRITQRLLLPRTSHELRTPLGPVSVKQAAFGDFEKYKAEYADCVLLAKKHNLPLREIYRQLDRFFSEER